MASYLMELPFVCSAMIHLWSPKTMPKEAKEEAQVMPKKNQRVTKRRRLFCYRPDKIQNSRTKSGMTVKTLG